MEGREREGESIKIGAPLLIKKLTCDVKDYHGNCGISYVGWNETAKPLLPRRVPQL